jgi:hypothetical protein
MLLMAFQILCGLVMLGMSFTPLVLSAYFFQLMTTSACSIGMLLVNLFYTYYNVVLTGFTIAWHGKPLDIHWVY